jgi:hypothetical protein
MEHGLTIETFHDGSPSSLWFSYNSWAAANVLEAILWLIQNGCREEHVSRYPKLKN